MPSATQAAARNASPKRIDLGGSVAPSHSVRRGGPSRTNPTTLTKQKTASAAVAARPARAIAPSDPIPHASVGGYVQERLQGEPFGGETVQRRQAGDSRRSDEERCACPRHAPQQAAELVELERANGLLERTCAEKEERLEDGMIDRVQQGGRQCERSPLVGTRTP